MAKAQVDIAILTIKDPSVRVVEGIPGTSNNDNL